MQFVELENNFIVVIGLILLSAILFWIAISSIGFITRGRNYNAQGIKNK